MTLFEKSNTLGIALVYAGAALAGLGASWLGIPLPWMIGPMVFATFAGVLGGNVRIPAVTRPVGQTVVAGVVGLSFTPAAVTALGEQIVPMVAVALLTVVAGFIVAAVLMRLTAIDVISASLASIPGGPVEMAALATRYGVAPGPVAFAQTLRIALLVIIVPPLLVAIDGGTRDVAALAAGGTGEPAGAMLLLAIATAGGFVFRWLRISSPFFMGALGFSALASALTLPVAMPPYWVLSVAQIMLGVWLGFMFDREMLARAKGFIPAAFVTTGLLLLLCAGMAFGLSALTGIEWQTMVLATAPGSVTEMALTAKILHQGVAVVTAFHVVRLFIIIPSAPLIFAVTARLARRRADDGASRG